MLNIPVRQSGEEKKGTAGKHSRLNTEIWARLGNVHVPQEFKKWALHVWATFSSKCQGHGQRYGQGWAVFPLELKKWTLHGWATLSSTCKDMDKDMGTAGQRSHHVRGKEIGTKQLGNTLVKVQ